MLHAEVEALRADIEVLRTDVETLCEDNIRLQTHCNLSQYLWPRPRRPER
jgi:hypothetical protein